MLSHLLPSRLAAFQSPGQQLPCRPCCKLHLACFSVLLVLFQFEISPVLEKNEDCYFGKGSAYRGTRSLTTSGASCLQWNSVILRGKINTAWKTNAQALGLGRHNHCRYVAQGPRGSGLGKGQD